MRHSLMRSTGVIWPPKHSDAITELLDWSSIIRRTQTKGFNESLERRWLLSPTWVVQKIAGERRAPIFEHPHECATRQVRRCVRFQDERQTYAIDRGLDQGFHVVDDQRSLDGNGE